MKMAHGLVLALTGYIEEHIVNTLENVNIIEIKKRHFKIKKKDNVN
jgi:hypothetical protein